MEATSVIKLLALSVLLVLSIAVEADTAVSIPSPPLPCNKKCARKCQDKITISSLICYGTCLLKCKTSPSNLANYHCARGCVLSTLHRQPRIKNVEALVNRCYSNCTRD